MSLLTLLYINEVGGSMTISGHFRSTWMTENIGWSPGSYNGASLLTIPYDKIWRPLIANSNAAGSAELFGTDNSYLTVYSTGQVMWGLGETLKFLCDIDTSYYPFDTQKCTVNIVTCGYQEGEIMFNMLYTPVKTTMFSENYEWEIIYTSASVDNSGMSSVSFHFHFKRRRLFLLTLLILPAIFFTMLNLLAFIVPHESGERLGFAMTLLLSIVVFLRIAQGLLPATAEPRLSAICIMLMATIIMSGMIVVSVIIGIIITDKKDEDEIPRLISKVVEFDPCRKQRPNSVSVADLQDKNEMKSDDDDDAISWRPVPGENLRPAEVLRKKSHADLELNGKLKSSPNTS